jgi:hypothetical protein
MPALFPSSGKRKALNLDRDIRSHWAQRFKGSTSLGPFLPEEEIRTGYRNVLFYQKLHYGRGQKNILSMTHVSSLET